MVYAPHVAPVEEEPDLDWGDDPTLDLDYEAPAYERGIYTMPPGSGRVDWHAVHEGLVRHRLAKGRNADGTRAERRRIESEENPTTVIQSMRVLDELSELPRSPRSTAMRAVKGGWEVTATHTRVHFAAVLYQHDSKNEEGQEQHSRGDVLFPAEDRDEWVVRAVVPGHQIGFRICHETRPKPNGKEATAFVAAWSRDPIIGVQFHGNATDFGHWLDALLAPEKPRAPRKTNQERADEKLAAPIMEGEWQA